MWAVWRTLMSHSGSKTEEKWRIKGTVLAEMGLSIMTAALTSGV